MILGSLIRGFKLVKLADAKADHSPIALPAQAYVPSKPRPTAWGLPQQH